MQSVFVSCAFHGDYRKLIACVEQAASGFSLRAVSVDQSGVARPIAADIERGVRESRVIVADVTGRNPNVLLEIGLAQAFGKVLILITQDPPSEAPFDIRHLRMIEYQMADLDQLQARIASALREALFPDDVLRSMLVPRSLGNPTRDSRFVIAASPLSWRRATNSRGGYAMLRRTESDYVGIRGIHRSFGQLYGFETLPDQIDPEDYRDHVEEREPMNVYCIASPKANRWTKSFLKAFGEKWAPKFEFRADPASPSLRNVRLSLFRDSDNVKPPDWNDGEGDRYWWDFGILVRGPNPFHPEQMFAVVAGRSSLGTQAACTAFTEPETVKEIFEHLRHKLDIEDHRQPFWALVSMQRRRDEKEEAMPESLQVWSVERFIARTLSRAKSAASQD